MSRAERRRAEARARRIRLWWWTGGAIAVIAIAGIATVWMMNGAEAPPVETAPTAASESPPATPEPEPTPLTPSEALLATTDDPEACAISFVLDDEELDPQLHTRGALFEGLPLPVREGELFGGWYNSEADAAELRSTERVNGAELADCTDRQRTLFGAWTSIEAGADTRVPILMYHQFTSDPEGISGWLRGNYAYIGDFEEQMAYIAEERFYLPTWDELEAFIDGTLYLPARSVIITDDDAHPSWVDLAVPIIDRFELLATSFAVTEYWTWPSPSPFVLLRSHTHDMHTAGDNGQGRMVNWAVDDIAADLEHSAEILGAKEVIAYPFGHYNDTAKQGVVQAGYTLARTIEHGYVTPGADKLALPVIRINYGDGVGMLSRAIG